MSSIGNNQNNKVSRKLVALIEEFRKLDPEMQAQQIVIFLTIVGHPDITMRDLEDRVGLPSSTISRNVAALSKVHRKGQPGHDLVVAYEDTEDRRFKRVRPTQKGNRVFNTLIETLVR